MFNAAIRTALHFSGLPVLLLLLRNLQKQKKIVQIVRQILKKVESSIII